MANLKIKSKDSDGFIEISDPEVLGKEFLTVTLQGQYVDESTPRLVHQFISKKEAQQIIDRLYEFVNSKA